MAYAYLIPSSSTGLNIEKIDIPLASQQFRIGRNSDNDLVINNKLIAPYHCSIRKCEWDDGSFDVVVNDLTNGRRLTYVHFKPNSSMFTYDKILQVNGVSVTAAAFGWINSGDVLTLGQRNGGPAAFTYVRPKEDLGEFGELYELGKEIGRGGFSTVYEAIERGNGLKKAVKVIDNEGPYPRETPSIVHLEAVFQHDRSVYIVLELFPLGSLLSVITQRKRLAEPLARAVAYQVNHALMYLHAKKIVHRDIKPENILVASLEPKLLVKVADFGLAVSLPQSAALQGMHSFAGTPAYMAPEIRSLTKDETYNSKIDTWSLGVTVFAMLAGKLPWSTPQSMEGGDVKWDLLPSTVSDLALDFLKRLLNVNPADRLYPREVVCHPWLLSLVLPSSVIIPEWLLDDIRAQNAGREGV